MDNCQILLHKRNGISFHPLFSTVVQTSWTAVLILGSCKWYCISFKGNTFKGEDRNCTSGFSFSKEGFTWIPELLLNKPGTRQGYQLLVFPRARRCCPLNQGGSVSVLCTICMCIYDIYQTMRLSCSSSPKTQHGLAQIWPHALCQQRLSPKHTAS